MRGEVLHYDEAQGFGFITGADGNRYTFRREDLRREAAMSKGTQVEFQPGGGQAKDIFSIRAQLQAAAPADPAAAQQHFGRSGLVPGTPEESGLWSYFRRTLTANYANFRGRARRKEYWGFALFWFIGVVLVALAGLAVDGAVGNLDGSNEIPVTTVLAPGAFMLATLLPWIAVTVRRQHDIGLSGWFFLLFLVPYIGSTIIFVFSLIPSQKHENKWGPVPFGVRV